MGHEWLEYLANSHCLSGCEGLYVRHYDETLPSGIMELVDKLRPMAQHVNVYRRG